MLLLVVQALGAGAFAFWGWSAAKRSLKTATLLSSIIMVLAVAKAVTGRIPAFEASLVTWDAYPYLESWVIAWPGMFLVGAGCWAARNSLLKRDALLISGGLMAVLMFAAGRALVDRHHLRGTVREDGACLQTSNYSCAPASAAALLHLYGVPATELEMARLCLTRTFGISAGTSESGLARGLRRKLEHRGEVRVARLSLAQVPLPALVSIQVPPGIGHSVLMTELTPDTVRFVDPRAGHAALPRERFEADWLGSAIWVERAAEPVRSTTR
jgi:predicted double-glycine peptidase